MKAPIKPKTAVKRTYAEKMALAKRISNRATINRMLREAQELDEKMAIVNARIQNVKGSEKQELVNLILKLNGQRGRLLIEANKLNKKSRKRA